MKFVSSAFFAFLFSSSALAASSSPFQQFGGCTAQSISTPFGSPRTCSMQVCYGAPGNQYIRPETVNVYLANGNTSLGANCSTPRFVEGFVPVILPDGQPSTKKVIKQVCVNSYARGSTRGGPNNSVQCVISGTVVSD